MITWEQLGREIIKAAEENPDRIYSTPGLDYTDCYYTWSEDKKTTDRCIVGVALLRLGFPFAELRAIDEIGNRTGIKDLRSGKNPDGKEILLTYVEDIALDDPWATFVTDVQEYQDCGHAWGDAVAIARRDATNAGRPID